MGMTMLVLTQVLHSGDLICEGIIKQQAEPAKVEEPKKEEPAAQEPSPAAAPAQPVPTAGVTANVAVISVSHQYSAPSCYALEFQWHVWPCRKLPCIEISSSEAAISLCTSAGLAMLDAKQCLPAPAVSIDY